MLASGGGRIVNVSSFAAGGLVGEAAYATAKAALLSLTRSIAKEYGSRRIACNAVVPGYVDTDMLAGLSAAAREARARLSPEARFGRPEEVAEAIVFLASDEGGLRHRRRPLRRRRGARRAEVVLTGIDDLSVYGSTLSVAAVDIARARGKPERSVTGIGLVRRSLAPRGKTR
jgi:NAD(P)-dependent dehydrogenase (short-subunit alcohol dehydrogenase family)